MTCNRVPGEVSETINGLPGLSDRVVFLERRVREFENRPRWGAFIVPQIRPIQNQAPDFVFPQFSDLILKASNLGDSKYVKSSVIKMLSGCRVAHLVGLAEIPDRVPELTNPAGLFLRESL